VSAISSAGLGSASDGLAEPCYAYRGTGRDRLEPSPQQAVAARRRMGKPDVAVRALAALRALGREATTAEIRAAVELDGGPAFEPQYLITVLGGLARRDPPMVVQCGREQAGRGRVARWRLAAGGGDS